MARLKWLKSVVETLSLNADGSADCTQEVTYHNTSEKPLEFTGMFATCFHGDCTDFTIENSSGPLTPSLGPLAREPYQTKVRFSLDGSLSPNEKSVFTIKYRWPQFRQGQVLSKITTTFDTITNYTVRMVVGDDIFKKHLVSVCDNEHRLERDKDFFVTDTGELVVHRPHLSRNAKMDLEVFARILKIELPVVQDVSGELTGILRDRYVVLAIIHLLRDSIPFFEALERMGAGPGSVFIAGIPYSTKPDVVQFLESRHYAIDGNAKAAESAFRASVAAQTLAALDLCKRTNRRLLVIEDGGYAVPFLCQDARADHAGGLVVGAVEQTTNGIWADREVFDAGRLRFPVINVAESRIKSEREAPLVGAAVVQNITALLGSYGVGIADLRVGLLGFGTIGRHVAERIRREAKSIDVYDQDVAKRQAGKDAGFSVVQELSALFPGKNLLVGCTGRAVIGEAELRLLDRSVFIVSATSKRKELKYDEFDRVTTRVSTRAAIGAEYLLKGGRRTNIYLLADGFPVNFFESSESIPDKQIQFIPALLLTAAALLVKGDELQPIIHPVPEDEQQKLEALIQLHREDQ